MRRTPTVAADKAVAAKLLGQNVTPSVPDISDLLLEAAELAGVPLPSGSSRNVSPDNIFKLTVAILILGGNDLRYFCSDLAEELGVTKQAIHHYIIRAKAAIPDFYSRYDR